jgi:hypothetical protein
VKTNHLLSALLSLSLCMSIPTQAAVHYDLEDFEGESTKGGISLVQVDNDTLLKVGISPDLKLGPIDIGLNINIYSPSNIASKHNLEWVSLRHIAFDYEKKHGFKWGRLKNLTMGQGLLMDNYDSGNFESTVMTTEKAGLYAYGTIKKLKLEGLQTGTSIQGGRVSYEVLETSPIFGSPLIVGLTHISDTDGVDNTFAGTTFERPEIQGTAIDIALPVAGDFLTLYSEVAQLEGQDMLNGSDFGTPKKGASTGIRGTFFNQLDYRAEYRVLGSGFVPAYFNKTYESTSFAFDDSLNDEAISGFLVAAGSSFMEGHFKIGGMYEKYDNINMATASLGWKRIGDTVGVINYTIPFQGNDQRIMQMDVLYHTKKPWNYVIHVKRNYYEGNQFIESYSMGVRFNLDKLFPNFNI